MNDKISLVGKRIVLAGGGSGGHVTPLRVVGEELRARGAELLWIGEEGAGDHAAEVASDLGIEFIGIPAGKWRRYLAAENLATPYQFASGVLVAYRALQKFAPDAVFGKGGYVSLPVVLAAHRLHIPIIIHESDVVMGWANRLAARYAEKICVAFPANRYHGIDRTKLVETGVPVRSEFFTIRKRRTNRKPQLFVTGGSQGSLILNQAIAHHLDELLKLADVVHLTGPKHLQRLIKLTRPGYRPLGWAGSAMAQLIADSDLVISRAGATTLAELAAVGRPAILVPLASAANNHQAANAAVWRDAGAAESMTESNLTHELLPTLTKILGNPKLRTRMAAQAKVLAMPQASATIGTVIKNVIDDS